MTTNIVETLPWIDFREVFKKLEERAKTEGRLEGKAEGKLEGKAEGKLEGKAEGKAERDLEIALRAFEKRARSVSFSAVSQMLAELGIAESTIETARKQYEADHPRQPRHRSEPER
jgi:predicted transposase YdaD